ncbi:response regulator transcription factor [Labilibacter sediminis]|nr:response regulator transcription factor [Labilibacter sediminis]
MKTLIIDDEKNAREAIKSILKYEYNDIQIVGEANGVYSGLEAIKRHKPDLVFLDINMEDGNGFDLLNRLEHIDFSIIFLTAYDEYAVKAFRYSAVDYLLKPIDTDDLDDAIDKVKQQLGHATTNLSKLLENLIPPNEKEKKLVLKTSDSIYLVDKNDVIRCEASSNYTQFYFSNRQPILVSKPLKEYDSQLCELGFFRSHQSHLINIKHISHIEKRDGCSIILSDNSQVPVSTRKKNALMNLFD